MRGRNRSKGPNPLTRTYESNGPDVKIRGTAQHIADKYAQLARDATVSGDPVSAENYLQHAEHYYRMIAAAQEAYRQQFGTQQRPFDEDGDEGEDEGSPNGYPYGQGDRGMGGGEDFADGFPGQPYEGRPSLDRPPQQRFDRNDRQDNRGDRGGDRNQRFDRNGGDRFDRNDRGDRNDRNGERFDRNGERFDRNARGPGGDRNANGHAQNGERFDRGERNDNRGERNDNRERFGRQEGRQDSGRNDGGRQEGGRRDREYGRNDRQGGPPRNDTPRYGSDEAPEAGGGLPAFLTAPVRAPITVGESDHDEPVAAPAPYGGELDLGASPDVAAEARPRRTRRPRRAEPTGALEFDAGATPDADKAAE